MSSLRPRLKKGDIVRLKRIPGIRDFKGDLEVTSLSSDGKTIFAMSVDRTTDGFFITGCAASAVTLVTGDEIDPKDVEEVEIEWQ